MITPRKSRFRLGLILLLGLFVLINVLSLTLLSVAPKGRKALAPLLLTFFLISLSVGLPSFVLILRRLLRPYEKLVDEAERAPVQKRLSAERDETEFVLETFQTVVAQLQTQGKQLEHLRAQASARAVSAEKFSERIVASVPTGLIAFNVAGRATMVNANARALLGVQDELEGQPEDGIPRTELLRHAPDLAELIEKCLQTGELHRREEFPVVLPREQRLRRMGATVAPIEFAEGRGVLCLLTDITEVLELREALALKRNLESLGEMSAGLAHELKNSLATLHGYAQLWQSSDGQRNNNGREAATAMLQEVRNLSEMVTAFLNFAKPQPLDLDDTSLAELIQDCAEELRPLYQERRVSLKVTGDFPIVKADDRMLRQAVLNIMRNAAEAIDENRDVCTVTVRGSTQNETRDKQWAVIEITDSGEGIPATDLQRIFIPFFTTKSKGYGVGLALAHRVITDHGGTISAANSAATGGALFTIKLPLQQGFQD